jgi:hypothetical protein
VTQDWAFSWCELGFIAAAEAGDPWKNRWTAMDLEVDVSALDRDGSGKGEEGKVDEDVTVRTEL